jgi:signal transduction histidine kinase
MSSAEPAPGPRWKFYLGIAPAMLFWAVLVGWLSYTLYDQTRWWRKADEASVREWLDESRVFRKSLPELAREYVAEYRKRRSEGDPAAPTPELQDREMQDRAEEIHEQLAAMTDPTRINQGFLPVFPEIYRIELHFNEAGLAPIIWDSPAPRPRQAGQVQHVDHPITEGRRTIGWIHCEYRLHAYNKTRRDEEERFRAEGVVGALVLAASALALIWVYLFLSRERRREYGQLRIQREKEHAEKLLLSQQLRVREAEHVKEELDRRLLEQSLETAKHESRAATAERAALELKSQLYASIGIMAGSYAHNIKNLLVRPNDLLARCLEADALAPTQESMLQEVRQTLGLVTERLQQILRTVRRDPSRSEMTRLDLNELVLDTRRTWEEMGREKWKLILTSEMAPGPLWVNGDLSHLQQAVENLIFNARDATFEMRNHLREQARTDPSLDVAERRQAVLAAAAWKGDVHLRTLAFEEAILLEVRDNGIGMTEEVRRQCMQTHFSTKRDNALYEGLSAGMGLGLSFVAVVLDHHGATMEVDSAPLQGATFRLRFPRAAS